MTSAESSKNTIGNNKRIVKNTIALTARMLITIAIGIYTSRVLLSNLGIINYGIYNLIGGVIGMFAFLNTTLINSTQRYLNYYIGKNDQTQLNAVFSTSVNIFTLLGCIVLILLETFGIWFVNCKLDIPDSRLFAANCVYQFTIISSFINIISTPYNAIIVAHERMTTFAFISLSQSIIMLICAFAIKYIPIDSLITYSLLICLLQCGIRAFYSYYCHHKFPHIRYSRKYHSATLFKEMSIFSGWTLTGTFTYMTYSQGMTILLNLFFGPIINAAQALASQVNNSLNGLSSNFMTASKPQITKLYAAEEISSLKKLLFLSTKMSFIIMSIVSMPFIIYTDYILHLWLKEVPDYTPIFLRFFLLITVWNTMATPAVTAIHATGNIKSFQIYESLTLIFILPMSYIALKVSNNPICAYIVMLIIMIIAQFVRIYFLKNLLNVKCSTYLSDIIFRLLTSFIISFCLCYAFHLLFPKSILYFSFNLFVEILFTGGVFYLIGFNTIERGKLIKVISNSIKKRSL